MAGEYTSALRHAGAAAAAAPAGLAAGQSMSGAAAGVESVEVMWWEALEGSAVAAATAEPVAVQSCTCMTGTRSVKPILGVAFGAAVRRQPWGHASPASGMTKDASAVPDRARGVTSARPSRHQRDLIGQEKIRLILHACVLRSRCETHTEGVSGPAVGCRGIFAVLAGMPGCGTFWASCDVAGMDNDVAAFAAASFASISARSCRLLTTARPSAPA